MPLSKSFCQLALFGFGNAYLRFFCHNDRPMQHSTRIHNQGFSLVQIAVLVAVAGIILASVLPGGELANTVAKERITRERMDKIEGAMQTFMAQNLRRPCPASGTLSTSDANFGVEAANPGQCTNAYFNEISPATAPTATGTTTNNSFIITSVSSVASIEPGMLVTASAGIASNTHVLSIDSSSQITLDKAATASGSRTLNFSSVVADVVPTKTLGLPDEYMFDGYGRRISYMVDLRATNATTCRDMQNSKTSGNVRIYNTSSDANPSDRVMWALISYGKDGYGAFSMADNTNRSNSGSQDTDQQINAFVNDSTGFTTTFTAARGLVRKAKTTTFDDTVWTLEATKNTCATGRMANYGARIDGAASEGLGTNIATGDINGDGIADIVTWTPNISTIRVLFGRKNGWTPQGSSFSVATANSTRFITISNVPASLSSVAVGDVDNDGKADIAIGSSSKVTIFAGSASPADTDFTTLTNIITLPAAPQIAMGDFNGDGKKDILALTSSSAVYVIYGKAPPMTITAESASLLVGSTGFKITNGTGSLDAISGVGNINSDSYDDILISGYTKGTPEAYLVFGRSPWTRDAGDGATVPDSIVVTTQTGSASTGVKFTGGTNLGRYTIGVASLNPGTDSVGDLLINSGNYFNIYYGKTSGWTTPVDLTSSGNYNGTVGLRTDVVTNDPSWIVDPMIYSVVGDINNDSKIDTVFTDSTADPTPPSGLTDAGTSFVTFQTGSAWLGFDSDGDSLFFSAMFDSGGLGLPLSNDPNIGFRIDGGVASDGATVKAITDINNDGLNDIIVGAPGHSSGAGSVYILFGHKNVPWSTIESVANLN